MTLRRAIALILPALFARDAVCGPTVEDRTLERPEGPRQYLVAQPGGAGRELRPAVILLHGHGSSAAWMLGRDTFAGYRSRSWMALAEREHILLLAPAGLKGSDGKNAWNDCRGDAPSNATSDDVGFISALMDAAVKELGADPQRIYVFGSSNGGGMAYRLAIESGARLAAIGVQSALMPAQSRCRPPAHPLPVLLMHGTQDQIAPYAGGQVGGWGLTGRGSGISVDASVELWRALAQLPDTPSRYQFPHLQQSDPTSATRIVWGNDPKGVQVELLRIDGGGHAPPSRAEPLPWLLRKVLGDSNRDVDWAEEAWSFFKDKRRAGPGVGL